MTFSMTFSSFPRPQVQLLLQFRKFINFLCFRVFFHLKQFNRLKLWCPPLCMPFALFNYSFLSSAVTNLSNKTLTFHDFQRPKIKFHDIPGLENEILKIQDFSGFPRPVQTLLHDITIRFRFLASLKLANWGVQMYNMYPYDL